MQVLLANLASKKWYANIPHSHSGKNSGRPVLIVNALSSANISNVLNLDMLSTIFMKGSTQILPDS